MVPTCGFCFCWCVRVMFVVGFCGRFGVSWVFRFDVGFGVI